MTETQNTKQSKGVEGMVVPCEVWSRIVGYYRPVQNWNIGKKQEFKDRILYDRGFMVNKDKEENDGDRV